MSDDLKSHQVSNYAIFFNCATMTCVLSWILAFNLVQVFLSWIVGLLIFLFYFFVFYVSAIWDILRNPWIKDMHFTKWNLFTTSHYTAWLLDKDEGLWQRLILFFGLPSSVAVSSMLFDFPGGITSSLFSILVSLLLIVVQVSANRD